MHLGQTKRVGAIVLAAVLVAISSSQLQAEARHKRQKSRCVAAASCPVSCNKDLSTLRSAMAKTGLGNMLRSRGHFTLFAPSNAAFDKMPKSERDALLADNKRLSTVLKYHVLPRKYSASDLSTRRSLVTMQGESVMLDNKDGTQVVDGALVTKADCDCGSSVVHVIDNVLIPERGK